VTAYPSKEFIIKTSSVRQGICISGLDGAPAIEQEQLRRRRFFPGTEQVPEAAAFHEPGLHQAAEFQQAPAHGAAQFQPKEQQIRDQGSPDLDEDGVLGGAVKGLDFQVLFDPLKKELDLPAAAVEFGHLQGGQVQAVVQKDIFLTVSGSR
jgi:hypothetical protein